MRDEDGTPDPRLYDKHLIEAWDNFFGVHPVASAREVADGLPWPLDEETDNLLRGVLESKTPKPTVTVRDVLSMTYEAQHADEEWTRIEEANRARHQQIVREVYAGVLDHTADTRSELVGRLLVGLPQAPTDSIFGHEERVAAKVVEATEKTILTHYRLGLCPSSVERWQFFSLRSFWEVPALAVIKAWPNPADPSLLPTDPSETP